MSDVLTEISFNTIPGLCTGHAQDYAGVTGCTVLLADADMAAAVDVRGGGPASRETELLSPVASCERIHALVLSGGSAFGLGCADGVMRYLEERGVGFDTGFAKVPLVCQSCIYDLGLGRADVRPDARMGYDACLDAEHNSPFCGSRGAGTGASVGKLYGMERAMKSGLGICAVQAGELKMAAVVIVNALGDIIDPSCGQRIAGLRTEDGTGFADSCREMYKISRKTDLFAGNTTIGAVVTNGRFSKAEMGKIASMTRCAYARCIYPVGTMADGDTIYAASCGEVEADINMAGTLAAEVMEQAILKAVRTAQEEI